MRIISNNFNKEDKDYPKKIICDHCKSELEYEKDDMHIGYLGVNHITCPCCGEEQMLYDEEDLALTIENLQFPTHYYHMGKKEDIQTYSNAEINRYVKQCVSELRKDRESGFSFIETGEFCVIALRMDGDYNYLVYVLTDYYDTCIPFESCDY